jgi:hypothetical protein
MANPHSDNEAVMERSASHDTPPGLSSLVERAATAVASIAPANYQIELGRRLVVGSVLAAFIAIATYPLWSSYHFYESGDGQMHLFRLFAFDQMLRQGVVYPRWLSNLVYGLGYPIYNYYPPLGAYLAESLHALGLGYVDSIKGVFVVIFSLLAFGTYAMVKELLRSTVAGVLAAGVIVFSPFILWDVYLRGGMTETLAVAILTWLVWSLEREMKRPTNASFLLVSMLLASLVFAHIATLAIVAPFLCVLVLFELFRLSPLLRPKAFTRVALSVIFACGISATYWFPFVVELPLVQMGIAKAPFWETFQAHLLAPTNLIQIALPYQYDGYARLGIVSACLGLVAFGLTIVVKTCRHRSTIIFWSIVAIITLLARTNLALGFWQAIPFSTLVQFPWRLSVLIDLGLAVVIGALPILLSDWIGFDGKVHDSNPPRSIMVIRAAVALLIAAMLFWTALAKLAPHETSYPSAELTLADLARFEVNTGFVGTTSFDEFLPASLSLPMPLNERIATRAVASPAAIDLVRYKPQEREFLISAKEKTSIALRSFHFPDWTATIDGVSAQPYASTAQGLLTLDVPAGDHRVRFIQEDTLARKIGTLLACIAALVLGGLFLTLIKRSRTEGIPVLCLMGLMLLVFLIPTSVALSAPPQAMQPMQIKVSSQLSLIGLEIEQASFSDGAWRWDRSEASPILKAYWQVKDLVDDKPLRWRLSDGHGHYWSEGEQLPRWGTGLARSWVPNEIVEDYYSVWLSPEIPSGDYTLLVAAGADQDFIPVARFILSDRNGRTPIPIDVVHPINAQVGDRIKLVGYDARPVARQGERYSLTTYWQTFASVYQDYKSFIQLLNSDSSVVAQQDNAPGFGISPTSLWFPGRMIAERQEFDIPLDVKPGVYRIITGMYGGKSGQRLSVTDDHGAPMPDDVVKLGEIKIPMNAQNERPSRPMDVSLGSSIRLLGYDSHAQPSQLELRLFWQAQEKMDADYKVFVHVVDANGNLVAQIDRLPGEGQYPTHIWDVNEKIVDVYALPLANVPPGQYTVSVGMYTPESGERLIARSQSGEELLDRQINLEQVNVASTPGR